MTFKPGDKVRYKDNTLNPEWHGWEGTVQAQYVRVTKALTTKPVEVSAYGQEAHLTTENLELIEEKEEPAFTFADIQVGDKIRRTLTRPSGSTEVREGVVATKGESFAVDTPKPIGGYILAYDSDGDPAKPQVKLELLERPEPVKELWEDAPVGTKIKRKTPYGWTFFLKKENGWEAFYGASGGNDFYLDEAAVDIFKSVESGLSLIK